MIVRRMRDSDLLNVASLAARMHDETRYAELDFSEKSVIAFGITIMGDDRYFAGLAEEDGVLYGMLVGHVAPMPFGADTRAYSDWFYVCPEKRGTMTAKKLVHAFFEFARERNARDVVVSVSSGVNNERAGRFLERLGFQEKARSYERNIEDGWWFTVNPSAAGPGSRSQGTDALGTGTGTAR